MVLTPEQEEIATFYAAMLDSDFVTNATFNKNFFADWKEVLGPKVLSCLRCVNQLVTLCVLLSV